jgi:hypothetical protein
MKINFINELTPSEAIRFYYKLGLNVIPVTKQKEAVIKQWSKYTTERISENLISKWERKIADEDLNIAIITKFNGLIVYDCDSEELYNLFKEKFKEVFGKDPEEITWVCKTGKGYHIYLKVCNTHRLKTNKVILIVEEGNKKVELRRQFGGYVVTPPSIHPSGVEYTWVHNDEVESILEVQEEDIIKLESLLNPELWVDKRMKIPVPEGERELTEEEVGKIVNWLNDNKYWVEGQRQLVLLALSYILRVFGKIKYDSVVQLYEKIRNTLGDDPKDYNQRISGIRLTFEKEIDDVGYRPWLEELGWNESQIEEFKFSILKILNKTIRTLFNRGLSWIYEVRTSDLKSVKDKSGNVIEYRQEITFKILTVKDGRVVDESRSVIKVFDPESLDLIREIPSRKIRRKTLTSKKLEYIKGSLTSRGTFVKIAIVENNKKHIVEGLLDDVLESLYRNYRVLANDGKEKLGQLLSFLSKFEDKMYNYPGIVLDGDRFIPAVPGTRRDSDPRNGSSRRRWPV